MVSLHPIHKNAHLTMYDLPSEDPEEPGLPDEFHDLQPNLLTLTCQPPPYWPEQCFMATDLNIYYDLDHLHWHKRPDWFVVLGKSPFREVKKLRLSYVMWQEKIPPYLLIELLSPGTEKEDLGQTQRKPGEPPTKWEVYEQILQIPYYVVYGRYENQLRVFRLEAGKYQEVELTEERLWLPEMELGLGLWQGSYQAEGLWLRFYDASGRWILTPSEQLQQAREWTEWTQEQLEYQRQRAEQERERAEHHQQLAQQERERAQQERERAEHHQQLAQQERERAEQERQLAQQERERAQQEQERAEQERERADRVEAMLAEERRKQQELRDRLIAMGINPDQLR